MIIFLQGFFKLLSKLWFILLVLIIGGVLLIAVPQANDIFFGLSFDKDTWGYFGNLIFAVLLWALSVWYGSRMLISMIFKKPTNMVMTGMIEWAVKYLPRLLGLIPFVILITSIEKNSRGIIFVGITSFLAILFLLFTIKRRKLLGIKTKFSDEFYRVKDLDPRTRVSVKLISLLVALSLLLLIILPRTATINLSQWIGPIATLVVGMAIWTWIASILTWIDGRTELPINAILFIFIILFSAFNDNDVIQTIKSITKEDKIYFGKDNKPTIAEHFANWQASPERPWSKGFDTLNAKFPTIYIVAGQGGGSRASFWTSGVLSKLDSAVNGFNASIYAMSTVSGSSVGAGFYTAMHQIEKEPLPASIHKLAGGDYLSPLNISMISGEVVQGISPIGVNKWDRAKYLEDAWSSSFKNLTGKSNLDTTFSSLWSNDSYSLPINIYNVTVVESGQKGFLAPLKLELPLAMDVMDSLPYGLPLKTAMSLSARFPFFTSTGTIKDSKDWDKKVFNLTDGGYYENTGLETALEIYQRLNIIRKNDNAYHQFRIAILYIQNSSDSTYKVKHHLNFLDFISLPVMSLYSTWASESIPTVEHTIAMMDLIKPDSLANNDQFMVIRLEHEDNKMFPLSRYISDSTQKLMIAKMNKMRIENAGSFHNAVKFIDSLTYE